MIKPDINSNFLKNPKTYLKFLGLYFLVSFVVYIITLIIIVIVLNSSLSRYNRFIQDFNSNFSTICNVFECDSLTFLNKLDNTFFTYRYDKDGNLYTENYGNLQNYKKSQNNLKISKFNTDFDIVFTINSGELIIESAIYKNLLTNIYITFSILLFVPYTILFVIIYIFKVKQKLLEKGEFKSELETRLQRDLTEMLHHELTSPLAVINSNIEELKNVTIPCIHKENRICSVHLVNDTYHTEYCNTCIYNKTPNDYEEKIEYFNKIDYAIERIKSILEIISKSKHIRFSNGTVPIYNIMENAIGSINSFKIHKLEAVYTNSNLLKHYSVVKELGNGNFLNILHVLFNNSIEAYATEVNIIASVVDENMIQILIQDNGSGILDSKGRPNKTDDIFKYGYSAKDENCLRYKAGLLTRFLDWAGFNYVKDNKTTRGIGLFISRETLQKAGGKLELYDTTREGTTFRLLIPVKSTIYQEQKKKQ